MPAWFAALCVLFPLALSGQMVIGGATPAATAVLDLQSTSKGFLPPRLSSVQRNAISSPAAGLTIYNTSLKMVETYNGTRWVNASSGVASGCGAKVSASDWKDFLCHNLGADQGTDPLTPSYRLVGNYYQWGRNPLCFAIDGADDDNPCPTPIYGALGPWGTTSGKDNADLIANWSNSDASDGSWNESGGGKTTKDPCPAGYRLPTKAEWDGVLANNTQSSVGTWATSTTNFAVGRLLGANLFLPGGGYRNGADGELFERGDAGYYWSSTESSGNAWGLKIDSGSAAVSGYARTSGFSIRCIRE